MAKRYAAFLFTLVLAGTTWAQDQSVKPGINDPFKDPDLKKYLATFEGESREIFTQRQEIVAACGLKSGMTVADIGAGTGLFTRLFAKEVGREGKVYAVDIAKKFIDHVLETSKKEKLENVVGVVCTPTSAELPANSIDIAFVCDTYHHFEFPQRTLASIHKALKPGGRLIVIDFIRIEGKSRQWIVDHVRAGQEVFCGEIRQAGFKQVDEKKFLKENYLVRFEKVEKP